jgi:RNA polymerase sigma factor (sigma-70 family)
VDREDRDAAILDRQVQIRALVGRYCRRWSFVDRDDMMQEAQLCLLSAWERYDGSVQWATFADRRITGALLDYRRRIDPLTRRQRAKVLSGESCFSEVSLDEIQERHEPIQRGESPEELAAAIERIGLIQEIIESAGLDGRETDVVRAIMSGEVVRFGLCQSRISQIRTNALIKLRRAAIRKKITHA